MHKIIALKHAGGYNTNTNPITISNKNQNKIKQS